MRVKNKKKNYYKKLKMLYKNHPIVIIIFILFIISVGIIAYEKTFVESMLIEDSKSWPQTKAVMTKSNPRIEKIYSQSRSLKYYYNDVEYKYVVNDKEYRSTRLYFGHDFPNKLNEKDEMEKYLKLYPVGKVINIYYNPSKPEISTILINKGNYVKSFFLGIFFYAVLISIYFLIKKKSYVPYFKNNI